MPAGPETCGRAHLAFFVLQSLRCSTPSPPPQALILNASLLYAVRRQATRRASSYDQAPPWYKLLTCRWAALCWGGPDTAAHQTSWLGLPGCAAGPMGWAAGGAKRACEIVMLLGGGFLLVTGLYPAIPEPVAFCASAEACTTSFVATWHQRCVFLGGGLLFSGVLCRLVLALVAGQRPACCFGTEVLALLGLVYFGGRSLITFTEATNRNISWLPRLKVRIPCVATSPRRLVVISRAGSFCFGVRGACRRAGLFCSSPTGEPMPLAGLHRQSLTLTLTRANP
eukprot:scaffold6348_cov117-Isochrysis_galbana.AAC.1